MDKKLMPLGEAIQRALESIPDACFRPARSSYSLRVTRYGTLEIYCATHGVPACGFTIKFDPYWPNSLRVTFPKVPEHSLPPVPRREHKQYRPLVKEQVLTALLDLLPTKETPKCP